MNKKAWLIFGAICVVLFGGLIYLSVKDRVDVSNVDQNKIQPADSKDGNIADHVYGKKDSPVILVEYGDYQCPSCEDAYPQVKKISEKYKDQIAYVFRNLPLTTIHQNALAAAGAAEAAGLEGKYWELHNLLYQDQSSWINLSGSQLTDEFVSLAKQVGVNESKFRDNLSSPEVQQKIKFDRALYAKISNSPSTPTFVLDGKQVSDSVASNVVQGDGSQLDAVIASALKAHHIALPTTKK